MSEAELAKYFLTKKVPYAKPLYAIDLKKKDDVLTWFRDTEYSLGNYFRPLFREQKENMTFFIGAGINPNFASPFTATFATTSDLYAEPQQLFINETYRVTMAQTTELVSNELVPDVLPNSEDYSDKVACNVVKEWLDSMNYDLNTDLWRFKWVLQQKMFGEAFVIPEWDDQIGDLHPDAKEFIHEELTFRDTSGNPIIDISGKEMTIKKHTRIGDIRFVNPMPWDVMIDCEKRFDEANWFYYKQWIDVEWLKKKYPKYDWKMTSGEKRFDPYTGGEKDDENRRLIYHLYHRTTEFLPEGRHIIASKENVLKNTALKSPTLLNNQKLPLVRFCDLDIGYGVRGIPILPRNTKSIVDAYNRCSNQMYNNLEMESPKLLVHETAGVDAQRMPNGTSVIEWRGAIKPAVETPTTNSPSIFNFRDSLKKDLDEMALQTPMVRGDVPNAQMDSYVALQHFEDLRNQLASPDIKGHLNSMEDLYRTMIVLARDHYQPDDGRLIKILGKHNSYQLKYFDPINLQKAYDVKITTTGNLANSKAARNQMMISIKREFPTLVSDEFFLDTLGLSHSKKFANSLTAAVSSAEAENHNMFNGDEILEPERFEDLITHWEVHRIPMQTLDFKNSPKQIKELFIRHVTATEKLMFDLAKESPTFQQRLTTLRQFPMYYTPIPITDDIPSEPQVEQNIQPLEQVQGPSPDILANAAIA